MKYILLFVSILFAVSLYANLILYTRMEGMRIRMTAKEEELREKDGDEKQRLSMYKLQEEITAIRGLGFLRPVLYKTIDRKETLAVIRKKMEGEMNLKDEDVLKKMGMLARGESLLPHIEALYTEQVQGMYDQDTGRMLLVNGLPLTGNIKKMFLVHELTHALQDQNFGLNSLPLKSKNNDRALAALAVVEGGATVVMFRYYKSHIRIKNVFWDLMSYLSVDQSELYNSPYYLRENLIFPYKYGLRFVMYMYKRGGWQGVNRLFAAPPESTEQIMHPDKYIKDSPVKVEIKKPIPGWTLLDSGTMGEFNIRVLLSIYLGEYDAIMPSEGWGGDKWQVWQSPGRKQLKAVWITVWDTEKDAEEFFAASRRLMRKRYRGISRAEIAKKGREVKLCW